MTDLATTPARFAELAGDLRRTPVAAEVRPAFFRHVRRQSALTSPLASAQKATSGGTSMATPNKGQKIFPKTGNEFVDTADITEAVCGVLRSTFGDDRHAAKKLARLANASTDTAKNWLSGRNPPGLTHFFRLAQRGPELRGLARRMLGLETDLDPELQHRLQTVREELNRILEEGRD